MNKQQLIQQIKEKKSFLCVGLDTDLKKIPQHLLSEEDPIFSFNKAIIDATADYCVAYKPNLAFYEAFGVKGMCSFEKTISYLKNNYPNHFIIADAKRGDIGNTSAMYARTFFEEYGIDSLTVAPYMGEDSVAPFLAYKDKWAIVLALTSNASALQFQSAQRDGKPLYQVVMEDMMKISTPDNMMFVVGATKADKLEQLRSFCPDNFFLVPGVGAQGGSAEEVIRYGANDHGGLLINSSRGILYASSSEDFASKAAEAAASTACF